MTTDLVAELRTAWRRGVRPSARAADLTGADLTGADLTGAYLADANLTLANLTDAYLADANLTLANLTGTYLRGANLDGVAGGLLRVDGLPSGQATLTPLPAGWHLEVGCWDGTVAALRELIATDEGWPEATGDECARRRPGLLALCDLCDAHIAAHPGIIEDLATRWEVAA